METSIGDERVGAISNQSCQTNCLQSEEQMQVSGRLTSLSSISRVNLVEIVD